jgi:FkbM family methyltransferase
MSVAPHRRNLPGSFRSRLRRSYWTLWGHARALRRDPFAPGRRAASSMWLHWRRYRRCIVAVDGIRLRLDRRVSSRMVAAILSGDHTPQERRLIGRALDAEDVVMELGGGIGMVAIFCAKRIGSERVFTYEANPALASLMRENFALNDVSPRAEFSMLGPREGTADFYVAKNFASSSTLPGTRAHRRITVPVKPLNPEIERIQPTFLVVDIEGGEEAVFRYARLDSVRKIMLEAHPEVLGTERADAVRAAIRAAGFSEDANDGKCWLYQRRTDPAGSAVPEQQGSLLPQPRSA